MRTVLFGQQKGGTGKSMLAANTAVGLARRDQRVIILDTDKQQTCVKWGSRRKLSDIQPDIPFATLFAKREAPEEFVATIEGLKQSGNFDYCIIDAGGRDNPELRLSLLSADFLVAPCLPAQADVESLAEFDEVVGEAKLGNHKLKCLTVINKANKGLNFSAEIKLAHDVIATLTHLKNTVPAISDRPNYRAAWLEGRAVYDLQRISASTARAEIERLIDAL